MNDESRRVKAVIFGQGGLMGRHLAEDLSRGGAGVLGFSHRELDIRDIEACEKILRSEHPDWLINAAAICNFDRCEEEPELSREVNLEAPLRLAQACASQGVRMVQFSSDYVFDGSKHAPYEEHDPPVPMSVYARHKAEMEAGFAEYPEHLVARLAWVFGIGGSTFMSRMPDLLMRQRELSVASGKAGSCLHARYGARVIVRLMESGAGGFYNVVHAGATSWEEVAEEILQQLIRAELKPACERIVRIPFREMKALAPGRPEYSVLDTSKLESALNEPVMPWREGVARFVGEWAAGRKR